MVARIGLIIVSHKCRLVDIEASADSRVGPEFTQIKEAAVGCVISYTDFQSDCKLINNYVEFWSFC
jgi:hypothetical protein